MTGTEAKELWLYMREIWPNYQLPNRGLETSLRERAWLDLLGDMDPELLHVVVASMATREFAPSPGQVREEAEAVLLRLRNEAPPDPDEAWREVRQMLTRGGQDNPEWSHPAIATAVAALGWRELRNSETADESIWRAHFWRCYGATSERHKRTDAGIPLAPAVQELARSFALPELAP